MNIATKSHAKLMQPNWNSTYMSAIAGAAEHFGLKYSAPTFFVESGYFAALNIQRDLKPCGPYCWNHNPIANNLEAMGLRVNWLHSNFDCQSSDYREHMLEQISAVDSDTLVGMAGLEFQLLCHSDERKFTFTLPWGPDVPTCVLELSIDDIRAGNHFPGTAWFTVKQTSVSPRTKRLHSALLCAVELYQQNEQFEDSEYYFGPNAWEQWATKLESGSYDNHGHWWSSMVWSEAREQAAVYFRTVWGGPPGIGVDLSTNLTEISSLIAKSANQEVSDSERSQLIRRAQGIDTLIHQNLETCTSQFNAEELN